MSYTGGRVRLYPGGAGGEVRLAVALLINIPLGQAPAAQKSQWSLRCDVKYVEIQPSLDEFVARWWTTLKGGRAQKHMTVSRKDLENNHHALTGSPQLFRLQDTSQFRTTDTLSLMRRY